VHAGAIPVALEAQNMSEVAAIQFPKSSNPSVTLVSGETLNVCKVMLFNLEIVDQIAALRMQGQKNLGGVSTGIGFWGSPTWVIEGTLVLGAIESMLSESAAKTGMKQLSQAQDLYLNQMAEGKFFDVKDVVNFELPQPSLWYATRQGKVDCRNLSSNGFFGEAELDKVLHRYGKMRRDLSTDGFLSIEGKFIHNGDEFVTLETNVGIVNVRWSQVAATTA
jgi:hypothetical protein